MIKCPKCQFEQPDDLYCAQCGINMKTFVAPKRSMVLDLITNQVFQVGVLFVGIVAFVVYYDSFSQKPKTVRVAPVAKQTSQPLAKNAARIEDPDASPSSESPDASQNPSSEVASRSATEPAPLEASPLKAAKKMNAAAPKGATDASTAAPAPLGPKSSLQISFYQASRNLLSELQRESSSSPFSGDGFGGILSKKRLDLLKRGGEMRSISVNRYKLDGHSISLFKGQRIGENAKNIGIYFQINPLKNEATGTQLEIKSWGNLKLQESEENFFTSEMTLNSQSVAFISGFLPKDKVFSEEEKAIFESDRALKIYTQEDFWDGNSDLILVVELPD